MPIERREIRLTEQELIHAIQAYGRQTPGVLPIGVLLGTDVADRTPDPPRVTVAVRLAADPDQPPVDVRISDQSLFELLIRFCMEEGIPLPRAGTKTAWVMDGLVTLVIENRR